MTINDFVNETMIIPALKLAARQHLNAYDSLIGDLSCGRSLGEHIRPEAAVHKEKFNAVMDRLARIDPECSEFRL